MIFRFLGRGLCLLLAGKIVLAGAENLAKQDFINQEIQPKEKWVFLDRNWKENQRRGGKLHPEIRAVIAAAQRRNADLKIYKTADDWEKYLKSHPEESVSSLFVSGHAEGEAYTSDEFSNLRLSSFAANYPGVKKIKAAYFPGCQTGTDPNMPTWFRDLPNLVFIAGFDGGAPSQNPSADFLTEAEGAAHEIVSRINSGREIGKSDMEELFPKVKETSGFPALGYVNRPKKEFLYISNGSGGKTKSFKIERSFEEDLACRQRVYEIEKLINISDTTVLSEGSFKQFVADYYRNKNLPDASDQGSDLRRMYGFLQRLSLCSKDFYKNRPLGFRGHEDVKGAISFLIAYIHSDVLIQNALRCSQPFFTELRNLIDRCGLKKSFVSGIWGADRTANKIYVDLLRNTILNRKDLIDFQTRVRKARWSKLSTSVDGVLEGLTSLASSDLYNMRYWEKPFGPEEVQKYCPSFSLNSQFAGELKLIVPDKKTHAKLKALKKEADKSDDYGPYLAEEDKTLCIGSCCQQLSRIPEMSAWRMNPETATLWPLSRSGLVGSGVNENQGEAH